MPKRLSRAAWSGLGLDRAWGPDWEWDWDWGFDPYWVRLPQEVRDA